MRHVLAAGAEGRRGPEIHDDAGRVVALVLQVAPDHRIGGFRAEQRGGPRRQAARIQRGEVAPRGHHVGPPARGRTGGAWGNEASVEGREQSLALGGRAGSHRGRRVVRCRSEHVEPVAGGHLTEIAQMRVEGGERVGHGSVGVDPGAREKAGIGRIVEDRAGDDVCPSRIEHAGRGIFLHEFT